MNNTTLNFVVKNSGTHPPLKLLSAQEDFCPLNSDEKQQNNLVYNLE